VSRTRRRRRPRPNQIKIAEDPNAAATQGGAQPEDAKISKQLKNALSRAKMLENMAKCRRKGR
jgi:hypothetical protein